MSKKSQAADEVRFFNVSLVNGTLMSIARFYASQLLVGEVIRSIETASPRFAWVQFLFRRANLSSSYIRLKNAIHRATEEIKTPNVSLIDGQEYERAELHRDWYRRAPERMKKIDGIVNKPHVLLAIQGMWVGDRRLLSTLPFSHCCDDHDRLGVFTYRNPWMLRELVERRMVQDISQYFYSYTGSRREPPSFVITTEDMPYYVSLPIAKETDFLKSIKDWTHYSPDIKEGTIEGAPPKGIAEPAKVVRLVKVPLITEPLKDNEIERLSLAPSLTSVRGLEIVYDGARTDILLSSESEEDMRAFLRVVESVYGELPLEKCDEKPSFLAEIPRLVGLA